MVKGYRANVDLGAVGFPITAVMSLALAPTSPTDVPARVSEFPLVESCYSVAGDNSYALVVRGAVYARARGARGRAARQARGRDSDATVVLSTPFERRPMLGPSE